MKYLPTDRRLRVAGVLLATASLIFGCTSDSSDDFSAVGPTSVGEPPNVQAGIPLPKDSVNRAVAKVDEIVPVGSYEVCWSW